MPPKQEAVQGLCVSASEAGSYLRLIDFVYHSTLGLRVIKKKRRLSFNVTAVQFQRGSSRFESLILSHHSRFTCECNEEEINDDDVFNASV